MSVEWPSIADLVVSEGDAPVALLGAPLEAGSVSPGRCDLAPAAVRQAMKRLSTYDLTSGLELSVPVRDRGDVPVQGRWLRRVREIERGEDQRVAQGAGVLVAEGSYAPER